MHNGRHTAGNCPPPGADSGGRLIAVFLLAAWLTSPAVVTGDAHDTEYQVKAAFIYNFAHFVSWPEPPGDRFRLCVIGSNPFGPYLDRVIGHSVHGSILVVDQHEDAENITDCHLAYISHSLGARLPQVLARLAGLPILTVSDIASFTDAGGMIELRLFDDGVRFDINAVSAGAAGLTISSKLLALSKRVSTGD